MQVTYHANKLQENQYTLHVAVMIRKIRKLRQFGKFFICHSKISENF